MRMYARLKKPLKIEEDTYVFKIMLYESENGFYLFTYSSPDAVMSDSDRFYDTLEELFEEWNGLIDKKGWILIDDPLPDCQHDAFIPVRVKGRNEGKPEWGVYETLTDGEWTAFKP